MKEEMKIVACMPFPLDSLLLPTPLVSVDAFENAIKGVSRVLFGP